MRFMSLRKTLLWVYIHYQARVAWDSYSWERAFQHGRGCKNRAWNNAAILPVMTIMYLEGIRRHPQNETQRDIIARNISLGGSRQMRKLNRTISQLRILSSRNPHFFSPAEQFQRHGRLERQEDETFSRRSLPGDLIARSRFKLAKMGIRVISITVAARIRGIPIGILSHKIEKYVEDGYSGWHGKTDLWRRVSSLLSAILFSFHFRFFPSTKLIVN